jgi:hypothetical protein
MLSMSKIPFQPSEQEKGRQLMDMNEEEVRGGVGGGGGEGLRWRALQQRLVCHT